MIVIIILLAIIAATLLFGPHLTLIGVGYAAVIWAGIWIVEEVTGW